MHAANVDTLADRSECFNSLVAATKIKIKDVAHALFMLLGVDATVQECDAYEDISC